MNIKIINMSKILLYLLPYSFIIGPFVSEILILICNFLILYLILKNKDYFFFKKKLIIFLLSIYLLLVLSSLLSEHILFSLKSSIFYFRWILLVISIHYISHYEKNFLRLFALHFFITFLIFFLDSHYQLLAGENILGFPALKSYRMSSFFADELILGGFIFKITPILLFCFFSYKQKLNNSRFFFIMLAVCIFSTIIISGERSAIILFLIFFIIFFAINLKRFKKEIFYVFLIFNIILGSIYIYSDNYKSRIFDNLYNQIFNKVLHYEKNKNKFKNFSIFSSVHEKHITSAYLMFRKGDLKSKLIGIGPKNFRNYCSIRKFCDYEDCCSSHPHNIPAQALAETGLIGLFILIYVYVMIIIYLLKFFYMMFLDKKYNVNHINILFILGIFMVIFPFSSSGSFFHNKFNILLFVLIGFFNAYRSSQLNIKLK